MIGLDPRVDTRPHIDQYDLKGVQGYGPGAAVHSVQTETVWRRLAHCGVALSGNVHRDARVSCPRCRAALGQVGYVG